MYCYSADAAKTDEEEGKHTSKTSMNWAPIVVVIAVIAAIWYFARNMSDKTAKRLLAVDVAWDAAEIGNAVLK